MIASVLAATALAISPQYQDPDTELESVIVEGRRLEQLAHEFIEDVAAPNRRRGLGRWNTRLCVGVVNLRPDIAQPIVDRVSDVARDLGVDTGQPGCRANAVIVAASDGAAMATAMVEHRRKGFDIGSTQITQSDSALDAFMSEQRPIRWWQMSVPVDSETGERAIRLPGDINPSTGQPAAPAIRTTFASRINSQIRDDLTKVFIIVDIDEVAGLSVPQLSDYLAMIVLAQIDARGETTGYDTVLNLFADPQNTHGLTEWDMAYLRGLYSAEQNRINPNAQAANVAQAAIQARREAQAAAAEGEAEE